MAVPLYIGSQMQLCGSQVSSQSHVSYNDPENIRSGLRWLRFTAWSSDQARSSLRPLQRLPRLLGHPPCRLFKIGARTGVQNRP